jgi:predicted DNA-binding transcriptional regulator AlpA
MKKDPRMQLGFEIDDDEEEAGNEPWALGDLDLEPLDFPDDEDGVGEADGWLDEQLGRLPSEGLCGDGSSAPAEPSDSEAISLSVAEGDGGEVVLRRSAPTRTPRRRRADPDAVSDLPTTVVPGYVRDRRGTWRYRATGGAVPGARDLTLRWLYRFPVHQRHVVVPVDLVRTEAELAWCLGWKHTMTTRLSGGRSITVVRVPVGEWERRADIPIGLWAPELTATRLVGIGDVARLAGVSPATITAYLSRRRMPEPVMRLGHAPVWSRPVIRQWLAARPGQGARRQR